MKRLLVILPLLLAAACDKPRWSRDAEPTPATPTPAAEAEPKS